MRKAVAESWHRYAASALFLQMGSLPLRRHRLWKFHGAIFRKTTQSQWQKWSAARILHFQKYCTSGRELLCVVLGRLSKAFNVGKIKKKIVYEGLSNAMAAYQS